MLPTLKLDRRQQPTLSPRLQYAVRLLQMSSIDFVGELQALAARNPFLELGAEDEPAAAAGTPPVAAPSPSVDVDVPGAHAAAGEAPEADEAERDPWQWDGSATPRRGDDDAGGMLDLLAARVGLRAHLHAQLDLAALPARELLLARVVVESLDDDGYLRQALDDLIGADELDPPPGPSELQLALHRVQSLDPAGVAARGVGECLLLQLPAIADRRQRDCALAIVRDHLPMLAARDIAQLARALGEAPDFVDAVCERIRRLDPRPGWRFDTAQVQHVSPDVVVRKQRGQWTAVLNPAIVPRLRLNHACAELFQRHAGAANGELAEQLQQARWALRNVDQRLATILGVARAIVRRQWRVFEFGDMAMRPLGLKEIADETGMHESTVSRVTSNKYMATPLGVLELKHFFSRAMVSPRGSTFSGTAIRGLVKELIAEERADAPLSDAQIARLLARQGLTVARRTVTKYRQALRIEPVERRRLVSYSTAAGGASGGSAANSLRRL